MSPSERKGLALEAVAYSIPWYLRIVILPVAILIAAVGAVVVLVMSTGGAESVPPEESVLPVRGADKVCCDAACPR